MGKPYTLTDEQKRRFAGLYVLEYMINRPQSFSLLLEGNDADLETVLEWLLVQGYVRIEDESRYVPTAEGRAEIEAFLKRYSKYLTKKDVFCAVDLGEGEFAFASLPEFNSKARWKSFLAEERWEDLRVAVAEYRGKDPIEVVFMSFVAEERFGRDATGWQFDLLLGSVWDEILEICNSALPWGDLGYESEDGSVAAEAVIEDIIDQGKRVMKKLDRQGVNLAKPITKPQDASDGGSRA